MLTAKQNLDRRWKKELRRKEVRKAKKKAWLFQKGHPGFWKGKKRSEADKVKIKEGMKESNYQVTLAHKEHMKSAKKHWWSRIKK